MKYLFTLITILIISSGIKSYSQCTFDPTVTGDTLLCPNATGMLTTQVYDSYQWYKRSLSGGTAQPIAGATSQTLTIDYGNDAGFYFSVEATLAGCAEFSPEVLVDGWAFLPPFTIIEGDYQIGGSGELILCIGDTIYLIVGGPYDTSIQWFDNGNPIAGANNDTLIVTTAGSYTFQGAPQICPNYIQNQFIPADVVVINCGTGIEEPENISLISPNPVSDFININAPEKSEVKIYNINGEVVAEFSLSGNKEIKVSNLSNGVYFFKIIAPGKLYSGRFIKN
jgi:hypothetical protein